MTDEKDPITGAETQPEGADSSHVPSAEEQARDREAEELAAKQRQGISGFEPEVKPEDPPPDPRAARRAELRRQLAALDEEAPNLAAMSDHDLWSRFLTALHEHLGSHPKLDAIITEMIARSAKA